MRKEIALMFALFALSYAATVSDYITNASSGHGGVPSGSEIYATGLLKDWQALSIIVASLSVLLVALARMISDPFNLPELKVWANVEWSQAVVTVAIAVFSVATLEFVDAIVADEVNLSPGSPVTCGTTDFCIFNVTDAYLDDLVNITMDSAREAFKDSIEASRSASYGQTLSCGTLLWPPCLWFWTKWSNNAFLILDTERYNQEIEQYNLILYSLTIQKFFVHNVVYVAGPVLLLIGIVARGIFITRRAGGILIALAMGIMFVYPMMYLWAMITMNVSVYGDKLFAGNDTDCPAECGYKPSQKSPCNDSSYDDCPMGCREMPYPYAILECSNPKVEKACMELPDECKVKRIPKTVDAGCKVCPLDCRIIPALEDDCLSCFVNTNQGSEDSIPFSCRIALMRTNFSSDGFATTTIENNRPDNCVVDTDASGNGISLELEEQYKNKYAAATYNCTASLNAFSSCSYVVPDIPDCECVGPQCCIQSPGSDCRAYVVIKTVPSTGSCNIVVEGGGTQRVTCPPQTEAVTYYDCPPEQRNTCLNFTNARYWNDEANTCSCLGPDCQAPSQHCNACFEAPYDYCFFNPEVNLDCMTECSDTGVIKPALLSPSEFVKKSMEGMYGRQDIQNVSALLLPAYLLPLINIVVTMMFIRTFSPIFGGDYELPGFAKVL